MAVHTPALPRGDLWYRHYGAALVLAVFALPLAGVLLWSVVQPPADQATIARDIRSTAALVDEHSAAMVRIGERVVAAATRSDAASRATWIAYGQHMIGDGKGLQELASRIRTTASAAEADPLHGGNAGLAVAVLRSRWEQLRADGRATAAHGRVMVELADHLQAAVRDGILTDPDVQEVRAASTGMVDAGEHCAHSADMLLASADQMQRWMGR